MTEAEPGFETSHVLSGNEIIESHYVLPFNPLNAKLNPICHLVALLGARHILHVSRIRVKHTAVIRLCTNVAISLLELLLNDTFTINTRR